MSAIEPEMERWKYIFDNAKVGIAICNAKDNRLELVNPAFADIHGYELEELIGVSPGEVFAPECMLRLAEHESAPSCATGDVSFETVHFRKDGSAVEVSVHITVVKDENGTVKHRIANIQDISERKKNEEQLKKIEMQLSSLISTMPDLVWMKDEEGHYITCNTAFEQFFGVSKNDIIGKTDYDFFNKNEADICKQTDVEALVSGTIYIGEEAICYPNDGSAGILEVRKVPVHQPDGKLLGVMGIGRDITGQKKAELALKESQTHLQAIIENEPECIKVINAEGNLISMNQAGLAMIEASSFDFVAGKPVLGVIAPEYRADYSKLHERVISGETMQMEFEVIGLKGGRRWLETHAAPMLDKGETLHLAVTKDITARKQMEEKVQKSELIFRSIVENIPGFAFIFKLHPDGKEEFLYVSGGVVDAYGLEPQTVMDDVSALQKLIHQDDISNFKAAMSKSARTLTPFYCEFRVCNPLRGGLWLESRSTPEAQIDGSVIWHGITTDVTKRKLYQSRAEMAGVAVDHAGDAVYISEFGNNGIPYFTFVNAGACQMLGYMKAELLGKTMMDIDPLVTKESLSQMRHREQITIESIHQTKDGRMTPVEISTKIFTRENKLLSVSVVRDITERKKNEEILHIREQEFRMLVDNAPTPIIKYDRECRRIYLNQACKALSSHAIEELTGVTPMEKPLLSMSEAQRLYQAVKHVAKSAEATDNEIESIMQDGTVRYYHCFYTPEFDTKGEVSSVLLISHDITERKHMETVLTARESEFRSLANNIADNIARWDTTGRYLYINPTHERTLGKSAAEVIGEIIPDTHIAVKEAISHVAGTGQSIICVRQPVPGKNGEIRIHDVSLTPEYDARGQIVSVLGVGRDMTDIYNLQDRLSSVAMSVPGFLFTIRVDADGHSSFPFASSGVADLFGLCPEDIRENAEVLRALYHPEDLERVRTLMVQTAQTLEPFHIEIRATHKEDGKERWIEIRSIPKKQLDGATEWHGLMIDITERKQAEEALREREVFLNSLLNAIPTPVFYKDTDGIYLGVNKAYETFFGATPAQLIGKSVFDTHPKELAEIYHAKDAEVFDGRIKTQQYESKIKHANGTLRDVFFSKAAFFDDQGRVKGLIGAILDITERKQIEIALEDSERILKEAQRIAHVGSWDVDIANDILTWSDETYSIWEIDKEHFEATFAAFLETVHPEDRELVVKTYNDSIINHSHYDVEHRLLFPDGRVKYIQERGKVYYDETGKPIRFIGTSLDLTEQKQVENALVSSRNLLYSILESSPNIITFSLDTNYRYLAFDSQHKTIMKALWDKEIEIGQNMLDIIGKADVAIAKQSFDRALSGESFVTEESYGDDVLSRRYWQIYYSPICDESGKVVGLTCFNLDITEQKHAQEALEAKEHEFRTLVENLPDNIVRYDLECRAIYIGSSMKYTLGEEAVAERIGKTPVEADPDDILHSKGYQRKIERVITTGAADEMELAIPQPSGKTQLHYIRFIPERQPNGEICGVLVISNDITEKRETEKMLEMFSYSLGHASESIYIIDFDTAQFVYVNDTAAKTLEYSKEELTGGISVVDIDPNYSMELWAQHMQEAETKGSVGGESKHRSKSGRVYPINVISHYFEYDGKKYSLAITRDITEQKQIEEELIRQKNFQETILGTLEDVGLRLLVIENGKYIYSNGTELMDEFGLNETSAKQINFFDVIHPDDKERIIDLRRRRLAGEDVPRSYELSLVGAKGERREFEVSVAVIPNTNPPQTVVVSKDIAERKQMQAQLAASEQEFRTLVENSPDVIVRYDLDLRRTYINRAWEKLHGISVADALGKTITEQASVGTGAVAQGLMAMLQNVLDTGENGEIDISWQNEDGKTNIFNLHAVAEYGQNGEIVSILSIARDVTTQKELETQLLQKEAKLKEAQKIAKIGSWELELPSQKLTCSDEVYRIFEIDQDSSPFSYEDFLNIVHPEDRDFVYSLYIESLKTKTIYDTVHRLLMSNGRIKYIHERCETHYDADGKPIRSVGTAQDVTEQKTIEKNIEFLAHHDSLTGLPNRILAMARTEHAIAYAKRAGTKVAMLFIDLDNFKTINDSLGHAIGDMMLRIVAARLKEHIREADTVSRQGGDEFLIVLSDVHSAEDVSMAIDKLIKGFEKPFCLGSHILQSSMSVGIAMYPDDGEDFDTLLQQADTAMYQAKEIGRNAYCFFAEHMNSEIMELLHIQNDLKKAIDNNEFVLYYQPQIDLAENRVNGAEALIRWKHPEYGLVPPMKFIPVAESSGLIAQIGEWVIMEACRQAAEWHKQGIDIVIAVNISAVQFKKGNLEEIVKTALMESNLNPEFLELELTESILIHDTENVLQAVQRLKAMGIKLSIDDFGTGYSSLSYLKRFAVDKLKIDQSFVKDILKDQEDAAIVKAVIQMAKSLNLKTIAEGVENAEVLAIISSHGCDEVQGYHFARPMPTIEFEQYYALALP